MRHRIEIAFLIKFLWYYMFSKRTFAVKRIEITEEKFKKLNLWIFLIGDRLTIYYRCLFMYLLNLRVKIHDGGQKNSWRFIISQSFRQLGYINFGSDYARDLK